MVLELIQSYEISKQEKKEKRACFFVLLPDYSSHHLYGVLLYHIRSLSFCFKKIILTFQAVTLAVVSFGVAVATVTDLEFNFFGACVALAWIVPSAVNKILWSSLQQSGNWTALAYVLFFLSLIQIIHNFIPLLTQIIHY
jgi:hypothetical protein